jgi:hypothetical protein
MRTNLDQLVLDHSVLDRLVNELYELWNNDDFNLVSDVLKKHSKTMSATDMDYITLNLTNILSQLYNEDEKQVSQELKRAIMLANANLIKSTHKYCTVLGWVSELETLWKTQEFDILISDLQDLKSSANTQICGTIIDEFIKRIATTYDISNRKNLQNTILSFDLDLIGELYDHYETMVHVKKLQHLWNDGSIESLQMLCTYLDSIVNKAVMDKGISEKIIVDFINSIVNLPFASPGVRDKLSEAILSRDLQLLLDLNSGYGPSACAQELQKLWLEDNLSEIAALIKYLSHHAQYNHVLYTEETSSLLANVARKMSGELAEPTLDGLDCHASLAMTIPKYDNASDDELGEVSKVYFEIVQKFAINLSKVYHVQGDIVSTKIFYDTILTGDVNAMQKLSFQYGCLFFITNLTRMWDLGKIEQLCQMLSTLDGTQNEKQIIVGQLVEHIKDTKSISSAYDMTNYLMNISPDLSQNDVQLLSQIYPQQHD